MWPPIRPTQGCRILVVFKDRSFEEHAVFETDLPIDNGLIENSKIRSELTSDILEAIGQNSGDATDYLLTFH